MVANLIGGWKKDPYDKRDYKPKPPAAVVLPEIVDNFILIAPIRDQQAMGSCMGHSIRGTAWGMAKSLGVGFQFKDYSPQWFWNGARFLEGTLNQNVGVWPRDAFQWAVDNGCLYEEDWPYSGLVLDMTAPGSTRIAKAKKYKSLAYYRVDNGITGIKNALYDGHVVSIGCPWSSKWIASPPFGILPSVTPDDFGPDGHATVIYAYDNPLGLFWAYNSWGNGWGLDGRFAFRFELIELWKKLGGYDTYYLSFENDISTNAGCNPVSSVLKLFKQS